VLVEMALQQAQGVAPETIVFLALLLLMAAVEAGVTIN
jgi:hypothetical protein